MRKILFIVALFVLIIAGCALIQREYHLILRKAPSQKFFETVENQDNREVSYSFKSELPDTFWVNKVSFDLNKSYASNLKYYMSNKYSVVNDSTSTKYNVEVLLVSCNAEARDGGQETAVGRSTSGYSSSVTIYNATVATELTIMVRANVDGKIQEKEIVTLGEYTGNMSDIKTFSGSFDLAIEKSLVLIDRYLDKTFGDK